MQKQLLRAQRDLWNGTAGSWAQGYRAGNLVFLQGQTGLTLDGEVVEVGVQRAIERRRRTFT